MKTTIDADWLSNEIRKVDGRNILGAGALAEKLADAIAAHIAQQGTEPVAYCYVYEWDTPAGLHRSTSSARYNGLAPDRAIRVYTHAKPVEPRATEVLISKLCNVRATAAERLPKVDCDAIDEAIATLAAPVAQPATEAGQGERLTKGAFVISDVPMPALPATNFHLWSDGGGKITTDGYTERDLKAYAAHYGQAVRAALASKPATLATEASPAGEEVWHAPGLGEVHSPNHKRMIYCEEEGPDGEMIASDALAKRVCAALASKQEAQGGQVPESSYQLVGEVQTLHELNDSWIQHLPAGTPLYAKTRTNVGSDGLSDEDRVAMRFQLDEWTASPAAGSGFPWLLIANAPKDGTTILLRSRKGRVADGCWVSVNGDKGYWAWSLVNQEPVEWAPMLAATPATPAQAERAVLDSLGRCLETAALAVKSAQEKLTDFNARTRDAEGSAV